MQVVDYETYLEMKKTIKPKKVRVEYATLEEINQAMIEAGLEPLKKSYARSTCSRVVDCYIWDQWGDWNGDGVLSTADIDSANSYICNYNGGPCSQDINIWVGSHPYAVYEFAGLTNLCVAGNELDILNQADCYAAQEYILYNVTCT